jgi:hypothetical protein
MLVAEKMKTKRPCCQSTKRCKRCPVVLKRLEKAGLAQRTGKRTYALATVGRQELKAVRAR